MLYILLRNLPAERIGGQHWAYLSIALGMWQVVIGLGQVFGVCRSGHHLYAVTGSFFNPAPYGAFISIMLVIVMAVYKKHSECTLGISVLVMAVMLPIAWSRASLLALTVCGGIMYRTYVRRHWCRIVVCAIVAIVILYLVKRDSADSRMLMMLVSLKTWANNFWVGTGVGGYLHALGEGQAAYFTNQPDSAFIKCVGVADLPFNEPLRLAVEQGIIGFVPLCVAIGLTAHRLWLEDSPLFYALVALLVFSLFSYPFTIPVFCAILTTIMAYAANTGREHLIRPMMLCSLSTSIVFGLFIYRMLSPRFSAEKEYERISYIKDKAFIKDYYELLPKLNDNPKFLFNFGSILRDVGRYNDSNAMLRQGTLLSADPMFPILMGRNYEDMQEYGMADSLYRHAFNMVPNRIYPLYRRMKLYETMEDSTKMLDMARRVTVFKVKVESPATRDMKKEAEEMITTLTNHTFTR